MIRNNNYKRKLIRRKYNKNMPLNRKGNFLNKLLIQFTISCIIVLLAFGIKTNVLNSHQHLNKIKGVLEYNLDIREYSTMLHKKATEVLKLYDEGESR